MKCKHVYRDGKSAIVFPKKIKWTGLYPTKIKGLCNICKQTIELSETEYKELKKG